MNITRYPEEFGDYRYSLTVDFTDQGDEYNGGNLVFIMLNPATVREESDLTAGSHTETPPHQFRKGRQIQDNDRGKPLCLPVPSKGRTIEGGERPRYQGGGTGERSGHIRSRP